MFACNYYLLALLVFVFFLMLSIEEPLRFLICNFGELNASFVMLQVQFMLSVLLINNKRLRNEHPWDTDEGNEEEEN